MEPVAGREDGGGGLDEGKRTKGKIKKSTECFDERTSEDPEAHVVLAPAQINIFTIDALALWIFFFFSFFLSKKNKR